MGSMSVMLLLNGLSQASAHLLFYSSEGQISEISFTGLKIKVLLGLVSSLT